MIRLFPLLLVVLSIGGWSAAQATGRGTNPWMGVWKLDPAASKSPGHLPQSATLEITQADKAKFAYTIHFTTDDGKQLTQSYEAAPDGKRHSVMQDGKEVAQASYDWASERFVHGDSQNASGTYENYAVEVSADGKALTEKRRVKTAAGDQYDETLVFRK